MVSTRKTARRYRTIFYLGSELLTVGIVWRAFPKCRNLILYNFNLIKYNNISCSLRGEKREDFENETVDAW